MSRFSHYEPCPKCREKGNDNRGDNLAVYHYGSKHCFSCSFHVFPKHYSPPEKEVEHVSAVLPIDFTREVPAVAWQWLLQYGMPYSYWKDRVGWSEKQSRLVFPVGKGPEFSIGRYIPNELAVAPGEQGRSSRTGPPRKWFVWGECHKTPHVLGNYTEAKEIVLVEDLISAHKLAVITSCISLFGTQLFDSLIPCLRHIGLPIILWLDKDQEGTMPRKCARLAALTGLEVGYRVTDLDPKLLTHAKILEILK